MLTIESIGELLPEELVRVNEMKVGGVYLITFPINKISKMNEERILTWLGARGVNALMVGVDDLDNAFSIIHLKESA